MRRKKTSPPRSDFRVQLDEGLQARLDDYIATVGLSRVEWLARVTTWFLDAPPTVRQGIVGQLPDDTAEDAMLAALVRMVSERGEGALEKLGETVAGMVTVPPAPEKSQPRKRRAAG